eukprot:1896419-Pyramimonas_sp.AAC.1
MALSRSIRDVRRSGRETLEEPSYLQLAQRGGVLDHACGDPAGTGLQRWSPISLEPREAFDVPVPEQQQLRP